MAARGESGSFSYSDMLATVESLDATRADIEKIYKFETIFRRLNK